MEALPANVSITYALTSPLANARAVYNWAREGDNYTISGDFVLRNMLVADGSVRIIDAAHVGKGTRAYDLACLLLETTTEDGWADPTIDPQRVESECLSIVGEAELRVCLVGRMLHYLVFGDSWNDYDPSDLVAKCGSFIERYEH